MPSKHIVVTHAADAKKLVQEIKGNGLIMLYFAEFCGHCRVFRPTWEALKAKLDEFKKPLPCTGECEWEFKELLPKPMQGVLAFPTIVFKQGDRTREFNGDRTVDALLSFINAEHVPTVRPKSAPATHKKAAAEAKPKAKAKAKPKTKSN